MQNLKQESLRNKRRNNAPYRSTNETKRAVCGHALINNCECLIITLVRPGKQDTMWLLDKEMCSDEELIDTLGDKINQLKKDGYEIDYRYEKKIILQTQ